MLDPTQELDPIWETSVLWPPEGYYLQAVYFFNQLKQYTRDNDTEAASSHTYSKPLLTDDTCVQHDSQDLTIEEKCANIIQSTIHASLRYYHSKMRYDIENVEVNMGDLNSLNKDDISSQKEFLYQEAWKKKIDAFDTSREDMALFLKEYLQYCRGGESGLDKDGHIATYIDRLGGVSERGR